VQEVLREIPKLFRNLLLVGKSLSGTLWTSAIIQEVWHHWQVVLIQSNETIQGHNEMSQNEAYRGRATIMLHQIYSRKQFMKPSDCDKILFNDIEQHLAQHTHQIMNWISVHQSLISHSMSKKPTD